jgi:hypothetical protein
LIHTNDTYFDNVGLPVDVFHFTSKHKEGDEFCGQHCNAAGFPELIGKDNKWIFNSSAAEQINSWMRKFERLVQEMPVNR